MFLVKGKDSGCDAWYYILVDRLKISLYQKDVKNTSINLNKYGRIIYSGWGEEPPEKIKEKIKQEYI